MVAKIEAPKANNPEGDVLILGAHYDHMGIEEYEGEPAIFHGADDNASGTAGILELARYISDRRDFLKKDVIVILSGAEGARAERLALLCSQSGRAARQRESHGKHRHDGPHAG